MQLSWLERKSHNLEVEGSIPSISIFYTYEILLSSIEGLIGAVVIIRQGLVDLLLKIFFETEGLLLLINEVEKDQCGCCDEDGKHDCLVKKYFYSRLTCRLFDRYYRQMGTNVGIGLIREAYSLHKMLLVKVVTFIVNSINKNHW